jgi:hypothetical protein
MEFTVFTDSPYEGISVVFGQYVCQLVEVSDGGADVVSVETSFAQLDSRVLWSMFDTKLSFSINAAMVK